MSQNPFKFTGLTYDDIMTQINSMIKADPRFANFRESDVAQFMVEMFAGTTDIINYYLQRRAEECYFDSAQHKSSVISLSRMFGYDVKRALPSKANIQMTIKGDLNGLVTEGDVIQIPYFVSFDYSGLPFILQDTFTYKITSALMIRIITEGKDFVLNLTQDDYGRALTLLQGDMRETVIQGSSNVQLGTTYQKYKIDDQEFSNLYGTDDWVYNKVARVYVGQNKSEDTRFSIDRKSLINWETISQSLNVVGGAKVCLIRSTPDEGVEIMFGNGGDNGFASLGAINPEDNIYIQYLGTKGSSANQLGVIGKKLSYSGKVYTTKGTNLSDKATFTFITNISSGTDIESLESIKYSAPKIYYSLDRLVTKDDYVAYLKSLTYPIDITNAIAWGEQEQKERSFADIKSYNAAFFSCLGSLYNLNGPIYSVKKEGIDLDSAVLDTNYSESKINNQSIYNVYTRQAMAKQVKTYQTNPDIYNKVYNLKISGYDLSAAYIAAFKHPENNGMPLTFTYIADAYKYASNLSTTTSAVPDFSALTTVDEIGVKLQAALKSITDTRGDPLLIQNENYGYAAFPGVTVESTWDNRDNTANIKIVFPMGDVENPNYTYIISFADSSLAALLGISSTNGTNLSYIEKIQKVVETPISDKIVSVIDNLASRSQITIQNIYIAPLIHSYELHGTVTIKPLYDKESVKVDINNSIYKWLNINSDFNTMIFKSNIIQLIEDNSAVDHVDMNIVGSAKTTGYKVATDQFYTDKNVQNIQKILSNTFDSYLSNLSSTPTEKWFFNEALPTATVAIHSYLMSSGTVDDFNFVYVPTASVGGIDYKITTPAEYTLYVTETKMLPDYSGYFLHALDNIRGALAISIQNNILDGQTQNIKNYTVGSEIAKIDCSKLNYVYKTSTAKK